MFLRSRSMRGLLVVMYMPLPMGLWQLAITFLGPSSFNATSTEHTRQLPKGSRLGASQSVGTGSGPLWRRMKASMVSPWMIGKALPSMKAVPASVAALLEVAGAVAVRAVGAVDPCLAFGVFMACSVSGSRRAYFLNAG